MKNYKLSPTQKQMHKIIVSLLFILITGSTFAQTSIPIHKECNDPDVQASFFENLELFFYHIGDGTSGAIKHYDGENMELTDNAVAFRWLWNEADMKGRITILYMLATYANCYIEEVPKDTVSLALYQGEEYLGRLERIGGHADLLYGGGE